MCELLKYEKKSFLFVVKNKIIIQYFTITNINLQWIIIMICVLEISLKK